MTYEQTLTALADPTRRAILEKLHSRPSNVASLAAGLPVSRPAVSQHLKILTDAGLLEVKPVGASRVYCLNPEGTNELREYLDRMWGDVLSAFAKHVDKKAEND